jgi:hypothetical protein
VPALLLFSALAGLPFRRLARDTALCLPGIGVVIAVYGNLVSRTSLQFIPNPAEWGVTIYERKR